MVPIQPTATPTRTTDLDEGLRGYWRILALGAHPDDIELGCGGDDGLHSRVDAGDPI